MGLLDDELEEVKKLCERVVDGSRLVSCVSSMVRVEIRKNETKAVTACMQFPLEYPSMPLLLELKSKSLSDKLLDKLTRTIDEDILKTAIGKPQILKILKFLRSFLDDNPLSCCFDEVNQLRSQIKAPNEIKIKQKSSKVCLRVVQNDYFVRAVLHVPDDYPLKAVGIEIDSNFPAAIIRYFEGQSRERARQAVEPPIRTIKTKNVAQFSPSPSLYIVAEFLVSMTQSLPQQLCQGCHSPGLPSNPQDVEEDESSDNHVERLYCNHLFHLKCLIVYMKTPPFHGGKKCPECGGKIFHEKWRVSERLAEERWAHQQARQRELDEVTDFFN